MSTRRGWLLWIRWAFANSFAEFIGLGATFAIGVGLFSGLSETPGVLPAILSALVMASSGIIEGVVVGAAQWWAMRSVFLDLPRKSWVSATVIGALVAWFLGSMPMTIASLNASGQEEVVQEPEAALMLVMASGMGLVAGLVLGFPQWRVLRRYVERGWLWLPANSIAWAVGMPMIFAGIDVAQKSSTMAGTIMTMAATLAVTGLVVGAIHGAVLVGLSGFRKESAA